MTLWIPLVILVVGSGAALVNVAMALHRLVPGPKTQLWEVMRLGFLAKPERFTAAGWRYWRRAFWLQVLTLVAVGTTLLLGLVQ